MSGKSPVADTGNQNKGHGQTTEKGPLTASVDDLPKYGLLCCSQETSSNVIHRVGMGVGKPGDQYEKGELRPPCSQGEVGRGEAVDGTEYRQEWRSVVVARRLPFDTYRLCGNPACFAGVEVEDL